MVFSHYVLIKFLKSFDSTFPITRMKSDWSEIFKIDKMIESRCDCHHHLIFWPMRSSMQVSEVLTSEDITSESSERWTDQRLRDMVNINIIDSIVFCRSSNLIGWSIKWILVWIRLSGKGGLACRLSWHQSISQMINLTNDCLLDRRLVPGHWIINHSINPSKTRSIKQMLFLRLVIDWSSSQTMQPLHHHQPKCRLLDHQSNNQSNYLHERWTTTLLMKLFN